MQCKLWEYVNVANHHQVAWRCPEIQIMDNFLKNPQNTHFKPEIDGILVRFDLSLILDKLKHCTIFQNADFSVLFWRPKAVWLCSRFFSFFSNFTAKRLRNFITRKTVSNKITLFFRRNFELSSRFLTRRTSGLGSCSVSVKLKISCKRMWMWSFVHDFGKQRPRCNVPPVITLSWTEK